MNCHHLVVDAMEGIWYADDSQITKLTIEDRIRALDDATQGKRVGGIRDLMAASEEARHIRDEIVTPYVAKVRELVAAAEQVRAAAEKGTAGRLQGEWEIEVKGYILGVLVPALRALEPDR